MRLSVIVPAHNAESTIKDSLAAIYSSDFKDLEVIVVDDASSDKTSSIIKEFPCKLTVFKPNRGDAAARNEGAKEAAGEILVFVDSDVVVQKDTLGKISDFFQNNPQADAVVGLLSKTHPNKDFFSQYKNLYMNFIFNKVKNPIDFLFCSTAAVRRSSFISFNENIRKYNDTELGKKMAAECKTIILDKSLEVIHLKKYTFLSFIRNDFHVTSVWAKIFLRYRAYKTILKKKKFAHANSSQILSILVMPAAVFLLVLSFMEPKVFNLFVLLAFVFFYLNLKFFKFLGRERGFVFMLFSVLVTALDMLVMGAGIFYGTLRYSWEKLRGA